MERSKWRWGIAIVIALFSSVSTALAQGILHTPDEQPSTWSLDEKPPRWDINLAAGAATQPTFRGSDRYRVIPVPLVIIRWRDTISLGEDGLNLYWHHDNVRIGGGVNYDGGRLDHETNGILTSGDNRLKGLGNIDGSVGVRGFLSYQVGSVYFDASAVKYFGPQNKGILVNVGASAPFAVTKRFILRPHIGATWADDNYMQTFFGVDALQSSRSIFPRFAATASVEDVNGGLTAIYVLNKHWFWGVDASGTRYLDSAARSPITITNTNFIVATVIGYHF